LKGIWDEILGQERNSKTEPLLKLEQILGMTFSKFAEGDIALQIFSEVLNCELWFCSNREMESQVKQDDPEAITYTVDEMRELIRLIKPTPEDLNSIHEAKTVFNGSRIVGSTSIPEFLK